MTKEFCWRLSSVCLQRPEQPADWRFLVADEMLYLWFFHPLEWLFVRSYVRMLWTYFPTFVALFSYTLQVDLISQWTFFPCTFFPNTWLDSLVVTVSDLRLSGREFDLRLPHDRQTDGWYWDRWLSSGGDTTSVFNESCTQANSAFYRPWDGKWVPTKVRWCAAAGE